MKRYLLFLAIMIMVATAWAVQWPEGKIALHVADDQGKAIAGATCKIIFSGSNKSERLESGEHVIQGLSDTEGNYSATESTGSVVAARVSKEGYYDSFVKYEYPMGQLHTDKDNPDKFPERWEPYPLQLDVLFRKIIKPVPMYAKKIEIVIPKADEEFGFDLMAGDWIAPLGKGKTPDLILIVSGYFNRFNDNDSTFTLKFSKDGDGLISVPVQKPDSGSELRLPYSAPEKGYEGTRTWRKARLPQQISQDFINQVNPDQNYFIRVRTVLDSKGNVLKALYGKILGDFDFGGASKEGSYVKFDYYLNPAANDRNVEFDLKRNLFTGLKGTDVIKHP